MTLSRQIAEFIVSIDESSLPPDVVEKARCCLLNGYGIALGCQTTPYAPVARRAALAMYGQAREDGATLLGDGRRTAIAGAAVANSALFHGRAQEDTCGAAHLGAIMIPLLTALLESRRLPAQRLLPALVAGYEAGGLLETAYSPRTTPAGLRASPLYGTVAAAAAASRLMGLDADRSAAALSNAASFAGGILQSFDDGTDEWRYQVGVAGQTGWLAAELANAGSVSAPRAFEGRTGFVRAFARTDCDVAALAARLGRHWSIHRVTFKPYPVCAFNQTPVIAGLALRQTIAGAPIEKVRVRMNPYETGYAGMDSTGPFNSLSGTLMSIPFCIAKTLLDGAPTITDMTTYDDARVNALIGRIDLVPDESVERLCCVIEARLADGRELVQDQKMTVADYSYDRAGVSSLVRRVGAESNVPGSVYDRLERFVERPQEAGIDEVLACFDVASRSVAAAAR
jgi:2-methylcitrate dehydratase PrpD